MKQFLFYLLLFTSSASGISQTETGFDIHSGWGIKSGFEYYLGNELKGKEAVTQAGIHFEFGLLSQKRIELETGLSIKYIRATGQIGTNYFTYRTFRLLIPAGIKLNFTPRWNASLGGHLQNNRDFISIFLHQPFNFRFDGFLQIAYQPSSCLSLSVRYQHALSGFDNLYFINDPQKTITCGLTYYLKLRETK